MSIEAEAQVNDTNMLTTFFDLTKLDITAVIKYLTSKAYEQIDHKETKDDKYSMALYRFQIPGEKNVFSLSAVNGLVTGAGYTTFTTSEYQTILKPFTEDGFTPGKDLKAKEGKTVYYKGNYSLIVQHKTVGDITFYVMMFTDLVKTGKLTE